MTQLTYKLALTLYFATRVSLRLLMGKKRRNAFLLRHKIRVSTFFPNTLLITKNGITGYARRDFDDYVHLFFPERESAVNENLKLDNDETFIDIGANVGSYSIRTKKNYPSGRVVSIEAHPETYKMLCQNVKVNNLDILCINQAVYREKGEITLYEEEGYSGGASVDRKSARGIIVQANTLDKILSDHDIQKADVIKIDIEGAETDALMGATKTLEKCRLIIVEIHGDNLELVKKTLLNSGFKIEVLNHSTPYSGDGKPFSIGFVVGKK